MIDENLSSTEFTHQNHKIFMKKFTQASKKTRFENCHIVEIDFRSK